MYSYKMDQNGSSTLLGISLTNIMAHPAENLQVVFLMFQNGILRLQNASKKTMVL